MHAALGAFAALAVQAGEPAADPRWRITVDSPDDRIVCAIDQTSWRRGPRGPRATELCVYGGATVGAAPFTHTLATLEWRCTDRPSVDRNAVNYRLRGLDRPLAVQTEGVNATSGDLLAWACERPPQRAVLPDSLDAEAFVDRRLAAWGEFPPGDAAPPPPAWLPLDTGRETGAACALATDDLVRWGAVAVGRVACVYDPDRRTPHRLEAGPGRRPLTFRHERGLVVARCRSGQLGWSRGELFPGPTSRRPYRIGSRSHDQAPYLGPVALYTAAAADALAARLCEDPVIASSRPGRLEDFVAATLADWGRE
jgi:hypothetical protein